MTIGIIGVFLAGFVAGAVFICVIASVFDPEDTK